MCCLHFFGTTAAQHWLRAAAKQHATGASQTFPIAAASARTRLYHRCLVIEGPAATCSLVPILYGTSWDALPYVTFSSRNTHAALGNHLHFIRVLSLDVCAVFVLILALAHFDYFGGDHITSSACLIEIVHSFISRQRFCQMLGHFSIRLHHTRQPCTPKALDSPLTAQREVNHTSNYYETNLTFSWL